MFIQHLIILKLTIWINQKQSGFTIVELLIVIVVIGILAAITIVAYNGIQTRAENAKTINGVAAIARSRITYMLFSDS